MRKSALALAFTTALWTLNPLTAAAETPVVVTSIKPVHSLVAGIMKGVGEPHLIVKAGGSPHSYALKPSDAAALERAKLVFWVGDELEVFLEDSIRSLADGAKVLSLAEAPGVDLLPFREGGPWGDHGHEEHSDHGHAHDEHDHEEHAHDEHDHDKHAHDEHAHDEHDHDKHDHGEHAHDEHDHDKHAHEEHAHDEHDHDKHAHEEHAHEEHGHDDHAHGENDMHIWLDPENAKAMVAAVAKALTEADPDNSGIYLANSRFMERQLDQLNTEMAAGLESVKDKPFVVFHDAYQYMERRFGLNTVGSITVSPERQPGAARLSEIRSKITELGARCIFSEPQFEPRLVSVVAEGTEARTGSLDPLGAALEDGPELYFELMRGNAEALRNCLSEGS